MPHWEKSSSNIVCHACMCTSAVGVSTPSRSKSTASNVVRSGRASAGTGPPGRGCGSKMSRLFVAPSCQRSRRDRADGGRAIKNGRRMPRPPGGAGSDRDGEGLTGDLHLLVSRDDEDCDGRGIRRDDTDAAAPLLVALGVDLDPREAEGGEGAGPHGGGVLADAGGEGDDVGTP